MKKCINPLVLNMKLQSILRRSVYFIVRIGFLFTIFALMATAGMDILNHKGKVKTFATKAHYSNQYNIPVNIRIHVPDSMAFYSREEATKKGYVESKDNKVGDDLENKHVLITNRITVSGSKDGMMEIYPEINSKGYVIAKSSNIFVSIFQIIHSYLGLISLVFILYQLMKIFRKDLEFNIEIIQRINCVGLLLALTQVTRAILVVFLSKYYKHISIHSLKNGQSLEQGFDIQISPRLDFDLTLFIVGLSLLVLGYLLKSGFELKRENELTI